VSKLKIIRIWRKCHTPTLEHDVASSEHPKGREELCGIIRIPANKAKPAFFEI
jgi:hypothetical protein